MHGPTNKPIPSSRIKIIDNFIQIRTTRKVVVLSEDKTIDIYYISMDKTHAIDITVSSRYVK